MTEYTPVSTTLADLRARCRLTCPDGDFWPDTSLDQWIIEAINLYSAQFPKPRAVTVVLVTGVQSYPLPNDCMTVTAVEYPTGESPRRFLTQVNVSAAKFGGGEAVYALEPIPTDELTDQQVYITFAETVGTGELANVTYQGAWETPQVSDDAALITVPAQHHDVLQAFVEYRGHWMLEANAAINSDTTSLALSELAQNARRAWNRYKEIAAALEQPHPYTGPQPVWSYK